jgi:putative peptide zinc metalloprotease protein
MVTASLWGLLVMPLYQLGKFFYVPGRLDKVKKTRMYATLAAVVAILAAVFFIPLPHNVMSILEVQAYKAEPVYVDVPGGGVLDKVFVKAGDRVKKDQQLALLRNVELELEIAKLAGQRRQYEAQLDNLRREGLHDQRSSARIPEVEKALKTVVDQLAQKGRDEERLRLVAPVDGTVLPPPLTTEHEDPEGQLPFWSGTPLDPPNQGAYLKESVMFCQIGAPRKLEAILIIDQGDIDYVHKGQTVDVKLDALPHDTLHSQIEEIAHAELKATPQRLSSKTGGDLATQTDKNTGVERPQSTSYQARAPLDNADDLLRLGLRGRGKIHADWLPLATRLWRLMMNTFNFKL